MAEIVGAEPVAARSAASLTNRKAEVDPVLRVGFDCIFYQGAPEGDGALAPLLGMIAVGLLLAAVLSLLFRPAQLLITPASTWSPIELMRDEPPAAATAGAYAPLSCPNAVQRDFREGEIA